MEMLAYSEENRSVVIPWTLDPDHEDLDLEVHGCGCGDGGCGSCGCSCTCTCNCSCSCDSTGANDNDDDNDSSASDSDGGDESSALLSCFAVTGSSTLGMDPVASVTGEQYNPRGDEHPLTTGARGLGEMSSPVDVPGVLTTIGTALSDPNCQAVIADAWDTVTDAAKAIGQQLDDANQSMQNAVDSIRESLRN